MYIWTAIAAIAVAIRFVTRPILIWLSLAIIIATILVWIVLSINEKWLKILLYFILIYNNWQFKLI